MSPYTEKTAFVLAEMIDPQEHGMQFNLVTPSGEIVKSACETRVEVDHRQGSVTVSIVGDDPQAEAVTEMHDSIMEAYRATLAAAPVESMDGALLGAMEAVRDGRPLGRQMMEAVRAEIRTRLESKGVTP